MDLGAFVQIENLQEILNKQNICVPRLRGLRLMTQEKSISKEAMEECIRQETLEIVKDIVEQNSLNSWCSWLNDTRNDILIRNKDREVIGYRWNKIHGRKRKWIKFEIKKLKKAVYNQYNTFNKYVGKNVLYVHARVGGDNWYYCEGYKLAEHSDFLEKCDDYYDCTYCDIYFKIRGEE